MMTKPDSREPAVLGVVRATRRFEASRDRLRSVAFRLVGSWSEAEDVVQEAWIRINRSDTSGIENFEGWFTTIVSRVALDALRARKARRDEPLGEHSLRAAADGQAGIDPVYELLLAESVGLAMLVVLDRLTPAERLAFVLHDLFDLPFEEIAPIVGRTPVAARQLASRARRRVTGTVEAPEADARDQKRLVEAYMAAAREGDLQGLMAVLDPEVMLRTDGRGEAPRMTRGAAAVAGRALSQRRGVFAETAIIGGSVGIVVAPGGRLQRALRFQFAAGRIVEIEVIADRVGLHELRIAVPVTTRRPDSSSR